MLRKQHLIVAGASLAGLFVLYSGASYWAGVEAEKTLQQQHQMLSDLSLFKVKSHAYQRGWFSSTETTELTFNRKLIGPYENMLPDNVKPLLGATIRYTQHVQHGPFPGLGHFDLRPGRALVTTQFVMSDSTRQTLKRFFGDAEPITVTNRLGFGGGGELLVEVPPFDYEETLSGVKMKWQGFKLNLDYSSGFKEYKTEALSPGFMLAAATKGGVTFNGVRYISDARPGSTGVKLGTSELTVGDVTLNWKDNVPYSIKLNELIYLLTRMRVGEFVNPSGEFKPSNVTLKNLRYQIVTSEQDEFINSRGKLDFEKFGYNDRIYGPMRLDISASHLHGPTLIKLDQELGKIPFEGVDPAVLRKQYIDTVKRYGVPLLTNNPKLTVNDFYLKMPTGEATLTGQLALDGLKEADLNDPVAFIKRFDAEAKVNLPRQTLEDLVVAQARNLFTVDASAEDQPDVGEIDNLAKSLLDSQLSEWSNQGYIKMTGGQVSTEMAFKQGVLNINKKKVPLPWEESGDLDDTAASAAK